MQILREKIEDKKNKVRRPVLHNQAYVDLIYAEIDTLQNVVAEIYDTERRNELAKEYEKKRVRTILRTIKLMLFHRVIHANKKGNAYQPRDNPHSILFSTKLARLVSFEF